MKEIDPELVVYDYNPRVEVMKRGGVWHVLVKEDNYLRARGPLGDGPFERTRRFESFEFADDFARDWLLRFHKMRDYRYDAETEKALEAELWRLRELQTTARDILKDQLRKMFEE